MATVGTGISIGHEARVAIDDGTNEFLCFARLVPNHTVEVVRNAMGAICGDPDPPIHRTQKGRQLLQGKLIIEPTGSQFDKILPLLGWTLTAGANDVYTQENDDTLTLFNMQFDLVGSIHTLTDCVFDKWAIRASKGSMPMTLELDYIASSEAEGASITATDLDVEDIYSYTDMTTFSIDAVSRLSADRILIQVNNNVITEWGASKTATDFHLGPRETVIATSLPYTSTQDDAYWTLKDDENGKATLIDFVSDERTLAFSAPVGVGVGRAPNVLSKADQIRTPVTLLAHRSVSGSRVPPLTLTVSDT